MNTVTADADSPDVNNSQGIASVGVRGELLTSLLKLQRANATATDTPKVLHKGEKVSDLQIVIQI